jgi:hypothetical protein
MVDCTLNNAIKLMRNNICQMDKPPPKQNINWAAKNPAEDRPQYLGDGYATCRLCGEEFDKKKKQYKECKKCQCLFCFLGYLEPKCVAGQGFEPGKKNLN